MIEHLEKLAEDVAKAKVWPGFKKVAYAVYNPQTVYLFNHPNYSSDKGKPYHTLPWNDQFKACTLILYEEFPTAIVDLAFCDDYASLYSSVMHELFHGFQDLQGESRFPDEILGMNYPLLAHNIELRNQERSHLYQAVTTRDSDAQAAHLQSFISLRDQRNKFIGEYLQYENLAETIEGPAYYVELQTYVEKSSLSYEAAIHKFSSLLTNELESALHLRLSCYESGLFLCLLLDEICPDWKEHFLTSKLSLFELVKEAYEKWQGGEVKVESEVELQLEVNDIVISEKTQQIVELVTEERRKPFEAFYIEPGTHLFIIGPIAITSFDPMNIVTQDSMQLHQRGVKVKINGEPYSLLQPVVIYFQEGSKTAQKLHLVLQAAPTEHASSLIVDSIGEIYGTYTKEDNQIFLWTQ